MLKQKSSQQLGFFIGLFFGILYLYLCFGTSPQCRNIEMRYFLQADVFMLIPAAFIITRINFISNLLQRFLPENSAK